MAINSSIIDNPIISITNQINQYKIVLMFYNAFRLCVVVELEPQKPKFITNVK